jgi:hypothetical protein
VANLSSDLASKASVQSVTDGLALKEDTLQDGGVAQSKVANLTSDLASKASVQSVTDGLALKENVIPLSGLAQDRVSGLVFDLSQKASATELSDSLSLKQNTLSASSTVALGTLNASAVNVANDSATNTAVIVRNNSATGISRIYNIAGTIENRAESQHLMTTDEHIISTSSAHPIRLQANSLNSTASALTIDTANQSVFGAPVGILKDPSTELDVNGGIACASLDVSGSVVANFVEADLYAPRTPGPINFTDKNGNTVLTLGTSLNSFLRGVSTAGALIVQGRNVLSDIDGKQPTVTANSLAISDVALLSDSLAAKEETLTSSSVVTVGSLTSGALAVSGTATFSGLTATSINVKDATGTPSFRVENTSGTGFSNSFLVAGGVTSQQFVGSGTYTIGTNSAHPIRIMSDRFNAGAVALQINTNATATFGSSVSTAGALTVQGRNVLNDIDGKQATLSSLAGAGETLTNDSSTLRRIFGEGGVTIDIPINNADSTKDFQLRVSGQVLQNQIDILTQRVEALEAA